MKIVIAESGQFRLSNLAITQIAAAKGKVPVSSLGDDHRLVGWGNPEDEEEAVVRYWEIDRSDPDLFEVVQDLGPEAAHPGTVLRIIPVSPGTHFAVEWRDGKEVLLIHSGTVLE